MFRRATKPPSLWCVQLHHQLAKNSFHTEYCFRLAALLIDTNNLDKQLYRHNSKIDHHGELKQIELLHYDSPAVAPLRADSSIACATCASTSRLDICLDTGDDLA